MMYSELVALYERLDATTKRLDKTNAIAELLRKTPAQQLPSLLLLLEGKVFPAHEDKNLGVASKLVIKAIKNATGYDESKIQETWKKTGDLGEVTATLIAKKKQFTLAREELSLAQVFEELRKIAEFEGSKSQEKKLQIIEHLLSSAEPREAKYIIKTILEELRTGVGEGVLRDAIVWAFFAKETALEYEQSTNTAKYNDAYKHYSELVQEAYDMSHDFGRVAIAAKSGEEKLKHLEMKIGSPLKVMLAIKESTIQKAMDHVGRPSVVEYKYDGFRVLAHKQGNTVTLFTRRLENVTAQFPEIVAIVKSNVKAKGCIIDGEAVGFDPHTKKYIAFQKISQRIKRKYDIAETMKDFPVELNVFDIINLENKSLLHTPLKERFALLKKIVIPKPQHLVIARHLVTSDEKEAKRFFTEALKLGHEGVMFKNQDAPYKLGARVGHMVKYKEAMDTLDLVIVGAEWGEGKRSGWLSSFLVACQDEEGHLLEIGRVSTGLKEKPEEGLSFQEMTEKLKPLIKEEKGKEVTVKPTVVIEVQFEEIQKSPLYTSGFALRFPRVIRMREDKGSDDVVYLDDVKEQYMLQRGRKSKE